MDKETIFQGSRICYRVCGEGPAVFLVHGFGEDGSVWDRQVEFLQSGFRLIVPDLPGSGRSGMVEDMSIEGMALVIKAIMDKEMMTEETGMHHELTKSRQAPPPGGPGATMIGHSMGGYITLAFAQLFPQSLNAFGLFHSTAYADSDEKKAARRKGIAFTREHGAFAFLKTIIPNLFSPPSKNERPGMTGEFLEKQHNFSAPALVSYYEAMINRPDRSELLQNCSLPVLFIMGKYDTAVPMEDTLKQCHLPGKSYIHILRKSGHMGMLEETEASNRILVNFLMENAI